MSTRERSESALSIRGLRIDRASYSVHVRGRTLRLSPRELDLLWMLMDHAGQVLTFRQLFERLWGVGESDDYSSLKTHVLRIRKKIEEDPHSPSYIRTVRGVGYIFDRQPPSPIAPRRAHAAGATN
jgi:two-component system alkaline phosphatase synthesis response regulator PhoP